MSMDSTASDKGYSATEVARFVLAALLFVALVVFCLANTNKVRIDYLFGKTNLPLIEVMGGSGVAGIVIAALVRRRRH